MKKVLQLRGQIAAPSQIEHVVAWHKDKFIRI